MNARVSTTYEKDGSELEIFNEDRPLRGTYALLVMIRQATIGYIGRLGKVHLQTGYYAYIGSALGPGGVPGRVKRHLRHPSLKRPHWHVDSLTEQGKIVEIWWAEGMVRQECIWAKALVKTGKLFAPGFGASDCRCAGHLVWWRDAKGMIEGWRALWKLMGIQLQRVRIEGTSARKGF